MQDLAAAVEATAIAAHLRGARWTYPLVNAGHVLGIALLVGAIAPLDLRLLGLWPREPIARLEEVLRPVAAAGMALAVLTGLLLFTVDARAYAGLPLFQAKMALLALALANAGMHARAGLATLSPARRRLAGGLSLGLWIAILLCGRLIGYL